MKLKAAVLFVGLTATLYGYGQSRSFVRSLDSNIAPVGNLYLLEGVDHRPLHKSDLDIPVDPLDIDQEKLNAALFLAINERRKRLHRSSLIYSPTLDILTFQYCSQLSRSKFNPSSANVKRMEKYLYLASRKVGFDLGYITAVTNRVKLMNYNGSKDYFYYSKDTDTDLHLFYGKRTDVRDSSKVLEPVPYHTYNSLARAIIKQSFRGKQARKLRIKQYSRMACWIYPIERSIDGRSIPEAKIMIVLGGSRLAEIEE
ncbi:hypothetical protein KFE98_10700 [bacterium SCSIO 12741]|nr:hypothetical protein KFE98_10700 [bacterium SCSIO 12741]